MAKKISELQAASALSGSEMLELVQALASRRTTVADLLALVPSLYKGLYTTLGALTAAHPTSVPGAFADVDSGSGSNVQRYIWDSSDSVWVAQSGVVTGMSNPMTTPGDIIVGASGGTPSRLGLGSPLQSLRVNAAGTGLEYAAPAGIHCIPVACSDETTALTAGTNKVTFRMPYAFTLSGIRGSLTTAQVSGAIFTVDVKINGTSILSTKLTLDNTEKSSFTAAIPAVISSAGIPEDAEITIDIDQVGDSTAKGLKVYLIGVPA